MRLDVGMPAPEFNLPLATGGMVSLTNLRGKPVVVYFYPKDDTPGCTTEACAFRDNLPRFGDFDAAVIGISKDSPQSHAAFAKKYGLHFHLASDEHSNTCETYGVWVKKSMYGKEYMGIERSTFLIDEKGFIRAIWRKVHVEGHAEEVLKTVDALKTGQLMQQLANTKAQEEAQRAAALAAKQAPAPAPVPAPPKLTLVPKTPAKPAPAAAKAKPAAPAKKQAAAKPAAKKAAPAKKPAPKKAAVKKPAPKKVAAKKPAPQKPSAKKAIVKKKAAPAKKPAAKKKR